MKKDIDCQAFADQLDNLLQGTLPEEGVEQLQLHAATCSECAMQLRVHRHLSLPPLEELESAVPEELLATVWPRVQQSVATRGLGSLRQVHGLFRSRWWVPAMAAATLALLFSTGFLLSRLGRAEAREAALAQRITELEEGLAQQGEYTEVVRRTGDLTRRGSWLLALSRDDRISVQGLRDRLSELPGNATVLAASQVDDLRRNPPPWTPPDLRRALERFTGEGGITVQDLLGLLDASTLSPEWTVETAALMELLS